MNDDAKVVNKCLDACNELLRGEGSAIETYSQAIEKFSDQPAATELKTIRADHARSAQALTDAIVELGGEPSTTTGAWGTFANAIQAAANLFGKESAIESLAAGENHGLNDYRECLSNPAMTTECKLLIQTELIPRIENNLRELARIESSLSSK